MDFQLKKVYTFIYSKKGIYKQTINTILMESYKIHSLHKIETATLVLKRKN